MVSVHSQVSISCNHFILWEKYLIKNATAFEDINRGNFIISQNAAFHGHRNTVLFILIPVSPVKRKRKRRIKMRIHKGCGGQIRTENIAGETLELCDTCMKVVVKSDIKQIKEPLFEKVDTNIKLEKPDTSRSIRG